MKKNFPQKATGSANSSYVKNSVDRIIIIAYNAIVKNRNKAKEYNLHHKKEVIHGKESNG